MLSKIQRYPLNQSPFYKLRSKRKLADLLRISQQELRILSRKADALYSEFSIKKKSGGDREVENPDRQLKLVQAKIARFLGKIEPADYLFCPVKGRCYVSNAAQHRGHRVVHCLDVRRYFPSTPRRRVYWFFRTVMQCEPDLAGILANIATFKGHLPTGSPLSPIMAYFAYYDVWENIGAICNRHGYTLTVYIDDVTVSGANVSADVMWSIRSAIHASGLRYHKQKSYDDRPAEITGVIVDGNRLVIPNRQHKKIADVRAALRVSRRESDTKKLTAKLTGLQGQASQIAAKARTPRKAQPV